MRRMISISILVLFAVTFISCSKDENKPTVADVNDPIFLVRVVDTLGMAVKNIRVGVIPISIEPLDSRSVGDDSRIHFSSVEETPKPLAGSYPVRIVLDYHKAHVCSLYNGYTQDESADTVWGGYCDDGKPVHSGYFFFHTEFRSDSTHALLTQYDQAFYFEWTQNIYEKSIIGETSTQGTFYTRDTLLFPGVLDAPLYEIDPYSGRRVAHFTDSVIVTLSLSSQPDKFVTHRRQLEKTYNEFLLEWNPLLAEEH